MSDLLRYTPLSCFCSCKQTLPDIKFIQKFIKLFLSSLLAKLVNQIWQKVLRSHEMLKVFQALRIMPMSPRNSGSLAVPQIERSFITKALMTRTLRNRETQQAAKTPWPSRHRDVSPVTLRRATISHRCPRRVPPVTNIVQLTIRGSNCIITKWSESN